MLTIRGISPAVDSCAGMIAKKAIQTYRRLPSDHKRWIDPEDLLQEGLLAAVQTERVYKKKKGAKYSTFLYRGLGFRFTNTQVALSTRKRDTCLVEIDKPIPYQENVTLQLPDPGPSPEMESSSIQVFRDVCRSLPLPCIELLASGLLLGGKTGRHPQDEPKLLSQITEVVKQKQVGFEDFFRLVHSEENRKMALKLLGEDVIMKVGIATAEARILECIECRAQMPLSSIGTGRYFVSTMTCRTCYRGMKSRPAEESCFGKRKTDEHEGYRETDVECRLHCPDRKICRQFIEREESMPEASATKVAEETLDDVDLSDVEEEETKPGKKSKPAKGKAEAQPKKAVAKKEEKKPKEKAKSEEVEEDDDDPAPKDVVVWPHKKGSMRRYCWQQAYKGVKVADLRAQVERPYAGRKKEYVASMKKEGRSEAYIEKALKSCKCQEDSGVCMEHGRAWPLCLANLRRAKGTCSAENRTHTWKLHEEGGRLKLFDIKYIGGKKEKKATVK